MSVKETVFQVVVAALSVIGFYGILHGLFEVLLVPRELATAVIITEPLSPAELDMLLCEARRAPFGRGKRVMLVLDPSLLEGQLGEEGRLFDEYAEIAEKYNVPISLTKHEPRP
ncbi:MAG: hypothetical protein J6K29_07185 [Clostridia bacterium]|nr:hypothetical protein [Clostridia bacterium]